MPQTEATVILSILAANLIAVITLVVKMFVKSGNSGGNRTNGQKKIDNGIQKQIEMGTEGTKSLSDRFEDQVNNCTKLWLGNAKFEGRMEQYMVEIRDRLDRFDGTRASRRNKKVES